MDIVEGIRYLDCDDLIECNKAALGGTPNERHVVNHEKLSGVQARPSQHRYYEQCEDIFFLAAVLFIAVNKGHAFENGNKRTGFIASQVFLTLNGYHFSPTEEDSLIIAEQVAVGCKEHNDPWILSSWFKSFSCLNEDYNSEEDPAVEKIILSHSVSIKVVE